jgi:ribosomal protein S21
VPNIKKMKKLGLKISVLACICFSLVSIDSFAQQGIVVVNQDNDINALLKLKKQINKEESLTNRYKIQVYSGNRSEAESVQEDFNTTFEKWTSKMVYEYPNFKIWAGNFATRLEADRALKDVKKTFNSAFIFKPKKDLK